MTGSINIDRMCSLPFSNSVQIYVLKDFVQLEPATRGCGKDLPLIIGERCTGELLRGEVDAGEWIPDLVADVGQSLDPLRHDLLWQVLRMERLLQFWAGRLQEAEDTSGRAFGIPFLAHGEKTVDMLPWSINETERSFSGVLPSHGVINGNAEAHKGLLVLQHAEGCLGAEDLTDEHLVNDDSALPASDPLHCRVPLWAPAKFVGGKDWRNQWARIEDDCLVITLYASKPVHHNLLLCLVLCHKTRSNYTSMEVPASTGIHRQNHWLFVLPLTVGLHLELHLLLLLPWKDVVKHDEKSRSCNQLYILAQL